MITKRVSHWTFIRKLKGLNPSVAGEIEAYIENYKGHIQRYEYGHIPGERLYRITLNDGFSREWNLTKRI